jgi:hypothetical protein
MQLESNAMTTPFKKLKDAWMKDAEFRAEYERLKPEFAPAAGKSLVEILDSLEDIDDAFPEIADPPPELVNFRS